MMDILNYIHDGSKMIVGLELGNTFDELIQEEKREYTFIVSNSVLLDRWSIEKLLNKYYIREIYELSNCYLGTFNTPYTIWHISKEKTDNIKTAVFYDSAHPYRDDDGDGKVMRIPGKYKESYLNYLKELKLWAQTGIMPTNEKNVSEYNLISAIEFDITKPHPRYYRHANKNLRNLLRESTIVKLNEIAEVIIAHGVNHGNDVTRVKSLDASRPLSYPYVPELNAIDSFISSEKLHENDIVQLGKEYFLLDKESDFDLYAPLGGKIIRAKSVSPEYLYLYLNSATAKKILHSLSVPVGFNSSIKIYGSTDEFPVVVPKESDDFYKREFLGLSASNVRIYPVEITETKDIEDALNAELIEKIKINGTELVKRQIAEDVEELNACVRGGAYKAAIIMAGSIMEGMLIDWLSEIKGIDYFENDFQMRVFDNKTQQYKVDDNGNHILRYANLADYINELRKIKKPSWMEEASEAHLIREKRNLVHAKVCLKENVAIDEDACKQVLHYLGHIIESRWRL